MEPAATIIKKLGGPKTVATVAKIFPTAPYRWQCPQKKGGTNGLIPQKYHRVLLEYAKAKRIKLRAEDFLPVEESAR